MKTKKILKSTVFILLILAGGLSGCARKGKAATEDPSARIEALEEEVRNLRSALEYAQNELASERQRSLELAELVQRYRQGQMPEKSLSQEPSAAAAQTVGIVPSAGAANGEKPVEIFQVGPSASQAIKDAYAVFSGETSSSDRLAALESLTETAAQQEPELLGLLEQALDDPDPDVAKAAARLLESYRTPAVLPLLKKALQSRDEEVRLSALEPLEEIEDARCAELAAAALSDPSEMVQGRALDVIRSQPPDIQIQSLRRAMDSRSDDVKMEVLSLLELRGDKAAVEVMFLGLKDPNPQIRQEVRQTLEILLDQDFRSYNQAVRWWKAHHSRYDENLLEQ